MMRSRVDLPEPDGPSSATISPSARWKSTPSSTVRALPSEALKPLPTFFSSINAPMPAAPSEMHSRFGDAVQPAPDPVVHSHHEHAHHANAQRDAREVADGRHLGDVAAQAARLHRGVAPLHVFGHDAGVPGTAT